MYKNIKYTPDNLKKIKKKTIPESGCPNKFPTLFLLTVLQSIPSSQALVNSGNRRFLFSNLEC